LGTLALPASGSVYVDANAIIYRATALAQGCTLFVTNDPIFRRVPGLTVAILSEIAATP